MADNFALVRYAKSLDEIPVKPEIIRKAPEKVFNWYIEKKMPYVVREAQMCGISGYEVVLPMLDGKNQAFFQQVIERVSLDMRQQNVRAWMSPGEMELPGDFFIPDGTVAKQFFLLDIIRKYIKSANIHPASAEVIFIEGDYYRTKALVESLYEEFNYLGIILEERTEADYADLADFVFDDCGLNINFGARGSHLLKSADIIINMSDSAKGYEGFHKRGACYIELSPSKEKLRSVHAKRNDITAVDLFNVEYKGLKISLAAYEMLLFLELPEFSRLFGRGDPRKSMDAVAWHMKIYEPKIRNLNL